MEKDTVLSDGNIKLKFRDDCCKVGCEYIKFEDMYRVLNDRYKLMLYEVINCFKTEDALEVYKLSSDLYVIIDKDKAVFANKTLISENGVNDISVIEELVKYSRYTSIDDYMKKHWYRELTGRDAKGKIDIMLMIAFGLFIPTVNFEPGNKYILNLSTEERIDKIKENVTNMEEGDYAIYGLYPITRVKEGLEYRANLLYIDTLIEDIFHYMEVDEAMHYLAILERFNIPDYEIREPKQKKRESSVIEKPKRVSKKGLIIQEWREAYPNGTKTECKKDTGISLTTIRKYW